MPPKFRPFTSFLSQGMQNTNNFNKNINQPYSFDLNNPIDKPLWGRKPDNQIGIGEDLDVSPGMPSDELPEGWEWQMVEGNWEPVQVDFGTPEFNEFDLNQDGTVDIIDYQLGQNQGMGNDFLSQLLSNIPGGGVHGQIGGTTVSPPNYLEEGDNKPGPIGGDSDSWWQNIDTDFDFDLGGMDWGDDIWDFDWDMGEHWGSFPEVGPDLIPQIRHTGGGGLSGQLAKKLYYPSTSGGFASAGSGITGASSSFMDYIKKMQGQ